jgi:hypothetical protein
MSSSGVSGANLELGRFDIMAVSMLGIVLILLHIFQAFQQKMSMTYSANLL